MDHLDTIVDLCERRINEIERNASFEHTRLRWRTDEARLQELKAVLELCREKIRENGSCTKNLSVRYKH